MKTKSKALLGLAALLLAVIYWWQWTYTPVTVNDADLIFVRPNLPESENGCYYLDRAISVMYYPKARESQLEALIKAPYYTRINTNQPGLKGRADKEVTWDPKLAADLISGNQATFDWITKALACSNSLVPAPSTWQDGFDYLKDYRSLARIMIIQARVNFQAGQHEDAVQRMFQVVQLGELVENAGGGLLHFNVGRSLKNLALTHLRSLMSTPEVPVQQLRALAARLAGLAVNKPGFTNTLKVEYQTCLSTLNNLPNTAEMAAIYKTTRRKVTQSKITSATFCSRSHSRVYPRVKCEFQPRLEEPGYGSACLQAIAPRPPRLLQPRPTPGWRRLATSTRRRREAPARGRGVHHDIAAGRWRQCPADSRAAPEAGHAGPPCRHYYEKVSWHCHSGRRRDRRGHRGRNPQFAAESVER